MGLETEEVCDTGSLSPPEPGIEGATPDNGEAMADGGLVGYKGSAIAHPNFALIKYWGKHPGYEEEDMVPANDRAAMIAKTEEEYLEEFDDATDLKTHTTIEFSNDKYDEKTLELDGEEEDKIDRAMNVVDTMLEEAAEEDRIEDEILQELGGNVEDWNWHVETENFFPTSAGLASSASGYAALAKAVDSALNLNYSAEELGRFARLGSGSAVGGLQDGFTIQRVPEYRGEDPENYGDLPPESELQPERIEVHEDLDMNMIVAVVSSEPKEEESNEGHSGAKKSDYYETKVEQSNENTPDIEEALREGNLSRVIRIAREDSETMHKVMRDSPENQDYSTNDTIALKNEAARSKIETGLHRMPVQM